MQDLAVGYGGSRSRYNEEKRVVFEKNLGPLISTDMTRCIHCTRCVRFGREIAGIMELGLAGRGEHSEIMPFVERTVESELSGNMIDVCPVGALTSKPFRYTARPWELTKKIAVRRTILGAVISCCTRKTVSLSASFRLKTRRLTNAGYPTVTVFLIWGSTLPTALCRLISLLAAVRKFLNQYGRRRFRLLLAACV